MYIPVQQKVGFNNHIQQSPSDAPRNHDITQILASFSIGRSELLQTIKFKIIKNGSKRHFVTPFTKRCSIFEIV